MTENEFLLNDRIAKIQSIINMYGAENFALSFSGGKDSTVLHYLIDMAIPNNTIPRIYADTGIELSMVRDFVYNMKETDPRIFIIKPQTPIKKMLENEGYPFKSKFHAHILDVYQRKGLTQTSRKYLGLPTDDKKTYCVERTCPKILRYQFHGGLNFRVSDKCCVRLKENPLDDWKKEHNIKYDIIGVMADEGGRRINAKCLAFRGDKLKAFQPLAVVSKEWETWFISEYNIKICDIYKSPYNFVRTGCKGCPFSKSLKNELEQLKLYFPNEYKQCELIWKPVYKEYRRIGYRL